VECIVRFREDYPNTPGRAPVEEYLEFFLEKLGVTT